MKPVVRTIHSQPSWILQNDQVELALTCLGGHMAPVTFGRDKEPFQPYYISPWQEQGLDIDVPVLRPLRGDFFCMPFGSNAEPWRSVQYPPHGEPAGAPWTFVSQQRKGRTVSLTVEMETKVRPGYVSKTLSLVDRHHAVYSEHVLSGFWRGAMPVGHHCTLGVTDRPGGMYVCTSPMRFGLTCPTLFSNPATGEYQSTAIGQKFDDLGRVPLLWKDPPEGDFSLLPARKGFTDLLGVVSQPGKLAWTIVVNRFDRYLWFSLRDPTVLPTTLLWVANQGRHTFPWNGRDRCLGVEDVCAYFAEGIGPSAQPNVLNQQGVPTAIELPKDGQVVIRHIQGAVRIPGGFGAMDRVEFKDDLMLIHSVSGKHAKARVSPEFLETGELE